MAKTSLQIFH